MNVSWKGGNVVDYQDVLAEVGAGSAHPGGQKCTQEWLKAVTLTKDMRVLDVGCGTGQTLIDIQRKFGCTVTGVDIRRAMVHKARMRSRTAQIPANWVVASAEQLPFPNDTFDFVYSESVNVFVNGHRAISECCRVLKPGGTYVNVEMLVLGPVSDAWRASVLKVYGAKQVPDLAGWKQLYREGGFAELRTLLTRSVRQQDVFEAGSEQHDNHSLVSPGAYHNPKVISILQANAAWFEQNSGPLGYGVFLCRKA